MSRRFQKNKTQKGSKGSRRAGDAPNDFERGVQDDERNDEHQLLGSERLSAERDVPYREQEVPIENTKRNRRRKSDKNENRNRSISGDGRENRHDDFADD